MDAVSAPDAATEPGRAPLVDVSGLPIADLVTAADTALARALRRVIADLDDPNGIISAFQSFPSP